MLSQDIFWLFVCLFLSLFIFFVSFNQNRYLQKQFIHSCTIAFKLAKHTPKKTRNYCILFTGSFLGCKHIQLLNDCKKDKAKIYQANQYMYVAKCSFNGRFIEKIGRNFNYLKIVTKGTYYFNSSCRCFTTKDRVMLSWHQAKAALS